MALDASRHFEHGVQDLGAQRVEDRAGAGHDTVIEDDQLVAVADGEIEVVQDRERGDSAGANEVEQLEPGPDVEVVGQLVEDEQAQALREGPRQQHPLALATGGVQIEVGFPEEPRRGYTRRVGDRRDASMKGGHHKLATDTNPQLRPAAVFTEFAAAI